MNKKQYTAPVAEWTVMDEEQLMVTSPLLNFNGDSGTGMLSDTEVNTEGLARELDSFFE